MAEPEFITTILASPKEILWSGEALTLTSENSEGLFDLYPDHARFMTLLQDVDLVVRLPEEEKVFHIDKAVLLFEDATAKIYLHKHSDTSEKTA